MTPTELAAAAVVLLPPDAIEEDPNQPRRFFEPKAVEELARSIESTAQDSAKPWIDGLLHPVVAYPIEVHDDADVPAYRLLVGARRLRAYRLREWPVIPTRVVEAPNSPAHGLIIQLAENSAREDTSLWEDARAVRNALDAWLDENPDGKIKDFAEVCGHSASWVSRQLSVTKAKGLARKAVVEGHIQRAEAMRLFSKMPERLQQDLLHHARVNKTPISAGLIRQHAPPPKSRRRSARPTKAESETTTASQSPPAKKRPKRDGIRLRLRFFQVRYLLTALNAPAPEENRDLLQALVKALPKEAPPPAS